MPKQDFNQLKNIEKTMSRFVVLVCWMIAASFASVANAALSPDISTNQIRDFTRLTFNWPEKIRFKVEPFDGGVTLTFNQPTDINLSQLKQSLGSVVTRSESSNDGTKITLRFDKPYRVRHFISGNANGIDILGARSAPKEEPLAPEKAPQKPTELEAAIPLPTLKPSSGEPAPLIANNNVVAEAPEEAAPSPEAEAATEAPAPVAPTAEEVVEAAPEPEVAQAPAADPAPAAEEEPAQSVEATTEETPEPTVAEDPAAEEKKEENPFAEFLEEPAQQPLEPAPVAEADQLPDSATDNPFLITTYTLATGTEIRFPWVQRAGAAVFMRGDVLWIVFNKPQRVDLDLLKTILPASVTDVSLVQVPGHVALRMKTDGTVYPKIHQPKNTAQWYVTLSVYKQVPAEVIELNHRTGGTIAPHIYISELQYDTPVTITDPVVGDEIMVVPFYNPGKGIYPGREYTEVELLPSAQGVAVVKKDDFAEIRQLRNGFRVSSRNGLSLSDDLPELKLAELEAAKGSTVWFPYDKWKSEPGAFFEMRRDLERQLVDSSDVRANSLRLKLAQLYLAHGFDNETLAWLQRIEESDPFFFKERHLNAMRGAAYFIKDDYANALKAFNDKSLYDEPEQKLWLDALRIFQEERPRFDYTDYYQTYISKYPPLMKEKLAILAADNYINRKSYSRALKALDSIDMEGDVTAKTEGYVYYLLGKIAADNGNIEGAKELWTPLLEPGKNRFIRATTELALTNMLYSNGEIELAEAINRLENIRIVWRGDALEMTMLNYLGDLHMENSDYLSALRVWQELVSNYPDAPLAITVASKMATSFNHLFAEGAADQLSPLDALAIFYEFRQLTPIGESGDDMIQTLADRLIAVDLLDRAAALLEHQVRFRQEKLARSKLGSQLALIYLLDGKPADALEKLELTNYGQMPADLALYRKRLAAMALAETDQPQRAIDMLSPDGSTEADELRLSLYWRMRQWPNVIATGESLLGNRPDVTAPLTPKETEHLLQLSIAYMFERNETQLQYLRNYFQTLVPDGPNKEIFMFVTDASGPVNPRDFEALAGQISRFEDFMQSYRGKVEEGGISPILN